MSRLLNKQDMIVMVKGQITELPTEELAKIEGAQDATFSRCHGEMVVAVCNHLEAITDNEALAHLCSELMPANAFDYDGRGIFILDQK